MRKHPMISGFILSAAAMMFFGTGCAMDEDIGLEAQANHSWGGYHWATSGNLSLNLGDNVTSTWDGNLSLASSDWSKSRVLDTTVVNGTTNPKNCKAVSGTVQVCNSTYGNTGWLGIAQIWLSGGHISQGVVKLNDTYHNSAPYNTTPWRNLVMCQEIGHTFGLDHQDENFNNTPLGTCMDYSNDPVPNQHPNQHDYTQLEDIYNHADLAALDAEALALPPGLANLDVSTPEQWGAVVDSRGFQQTYSRDLNNGVRIVTHVLWAPF